MERATPKHLSTRRPRRPVVNGLVVGAQYLALLAAGTFVTVLVLHTP